MWSAEGFDQASDYHLISSTAKRLGCDYYPSSSFTASAAPPLTLLVLAKRTSSSRVAPWAASRGAPVVKLDYVADCSNAGKILPVLKHHLAPVFYGVYVSVSGVQDPERRQALIDQVGQLGGDYHGALDLERTTHLVLDEPVGRKYERVMETNSTKTPEKRIRVVSTEWLAACFREAKLVDEAPFAFAEAAATDAEAPSAKRVKPTVNDVLGGCVLYIVGSEGKEWAELRDMASRCGALVLWEFAPEATHVVVGEHEAKMLMNASPEALIVRASWLRACYESQKRVSTRDHIWERPAPSASPTDHLASKPRSDWHGKHVCVSRYVGEERARVAAKCRQLGAIFTEVLSESKPRVALLVCKGTEGEKYEKAIEWGIPVVDFEWLKART